DKLFLGNAHDRQLQAFAHSLRPLCSLRLCVKQALDFSLNFGLGDRARLGTSILELINDLPFFDSHDAMIPPEKVRNLAVITYIHQGEVGELAGFKRADLPGAA